MKNLIYFFLIILLASCKTYLPASKITYSFDFTQFKDFYISNAPTADFKYEPIGLVSSVVRSGYNGNFDGYSHSAKSYKFVKYYGGDAVVELYNKAKEIGATGILNLKIEYLNDTSGLGIYSGWSASGMAIKKQ